jgi:dipeptidyl aminopeptidase/acylaminoacyl peptidase
MTYVRLRAPMALLAAAVICAAAAEKRKITEVDLYAFHWLADPQISPDGLQVAYTHVSTNPKHDGYDTAIWIVPADGGSPRQLTAGPHDTSPRWSPDRKRIAFVRGGSEGLPGARPLPGQIYVLRMDGGEARQLTDLTKGASDPVWSPDGRTIAFGSTTWLKEIEKKDASAEEQSDVRVITRAAYRLNGAGYRQTDRPSHIWTAPVPDVITGAQKATQVTSGQFSENEITWSPDGSHIYFTSDRELEPYYKPPDADVYVVSSRGGEIRRIAHIEGLIRNIAVNPAGNRIAFVGALNGNPIKSHSQSDLYVAPIDSNSTPKNLTGKHSYEIGGSVGGDQAPPRGGSSAKPFWSGDGRYIYTVAAAQGRTNIERIDSETGAVDALTEGEHNVYSYTASQDGSKVAVAISTPTDIGDLFILEAGSRQLRRLTNINEPLFAGINITQPKTVRYKSFDGRDIEAWVQFPPDYNASKKYPLILDIHGGPHAAYGYTFDHEFQWMAAKGYIVLYPNPRGSTSYGEEFANVIQYHYPGDDFKDLMAGVDEVIRLGYVDRDRLGVTGGSGGGLLTNWTIGQTTRFKAAVSQRSVADWRDFWYTADFTLFQPTWFRGTPWEQEADFRARSPMTYIDKISTPLMLIEGGDDMRTPPGAGGEQMFRALKYRRIPTVMVQFPGETHELSRSGRPKHRVERLQHIVAWFNKYLQDQNITTYDVK